MTWLRYILAILWITLKRMARNWRVEAALLLGVLLATSVISAIPIYASASLQKSFMRTWVEQDGLRAPFTTILTHRNRRRRFDIGPDRLARLQSHVGERLESAVGLEATSRAELLIIGADPFLEDPDAHPDLLAPTAELAALSNLREVAEVIDGRWYEPREDGVIEAVVDESTLQRLELIVGRSYTFYYRTLSAEAASKGEPFIKVPVEVVGLIRAREGTTTREWIYPPPYPRRLLASPQEFRSELIERLQLRVDDYDFLAVFPHEEVRVDQIRSINGSLTAFLSRANTIAPTSEFLVSPTEFFAEYAEQMVSISLFLTALAAPALGMLLYYVILISGVAVESRRSEMSVLHSRGAGRVQVFASFLIEWVLLGLVAFALGPLVGSVISRMIGSSTGFLVFVNRTALPVAIGRTAFTYAMWASLVAVVGSALPVVETLRHSIVTLRAEQARGARKPFWHRYYIDVILVALAIFGHRALTWEQLAARPGAHLIADPLLFAIPVIGIVGVALLLLRAFPLLMSALAGATDRVRGVVWQVVLRRLHRNAPAYTPVLLLLIVTSALGFYNASAGRTLSRNLEDRIRYRIGADLVLEESWQPETAASQGARPTPPPGPILSEPPLLLREEIEGVEAVARVRRGSARVSVDMGTLGRTEMISVSPHEFGRVAWYRGDLFPAHFAQYLMLLNRHPEGAIVSRSMDARLRIEVGKGMQVVYRGSELELYIIAIVDYWPGVDPSDGPFFITNLDFIQQKTPLEPYESWYRVSDDLDPQTLVNRLAVRGVYVNAIHDARQELVTLRREPFRMGFYGILSLGFLVAAAVTIFGFLIHTFYSIRGRLVQFGALRANGLSLGQLVGVVGVEQLAILGTGFGAGFGLGRLSTLLFVPFLQDRAGAVDQAPPFVIVTRLADVAIIGAVIAGLFAVAVIGLSLFLVRNQLFAALKLGEEA